MFLYLNLNQIILVSYQWWIIINTIKFDNNMDYSLYLLNISIKWLRPWLVCFMLRYKIYKVGLRTVIGFRLCPAYALYLSMIHLRSQNLIQNILIILYSFVKKFDLDNGVGRYSCHVCDNEKATEYLSSLKAVTIIP